MQLRCCDRINVVVLFASLHCFFFTFRTRLLSVLFSKSILQYLIVLDWSSRRIYVEFTYNDSTKATSKRINQSKPPFSQSLSRFKGYASVCIRPSISAFFSQTCIFSATWRHVISRDMAFARRYREITLIVRVHPYDIDSILCIEGNPIGII